jgi:Ca2+-transporting ATPase
LIPLAGYPLLYLPIHIVWLEMVIHPTAMLVFQKTPSGDGLARAGATRRPRFFSPADWAVILGVGLLLAAVVALGFVRGLGGDARVAHARAMAMACLTFASAAIAVLLSGVRTRIARVVVAATLVSPVLFVQVPALARRLHLEPLHLDDWAIAVLGGLFAVCVPPALRALARRIERGSTGAAPPRPRPADRLLEGPC